MGLDAKKVRTESKDQERSGVLSAGRAKAKDLPIAPKMSEVRSTPKSLPKELFKGARIRINGCQRQPSNLKQMNKEGKDKVFRDGNGLTKPHKI